jgi:type I restriction enzyme S subunit
LSYGIVQPGQHTPSGVPIVRVTDLRPDGISVRDPLRVDPEIAEKHRRTRLVGGEVLLSVVGTVGRLAVVPPELAGWNVARAIAVLRPLDPRLAPWLFYALQTPEAQRAMGVAKTDTVQATLNLRDIATLEVPLPDADTRQRIVCVLSSLDDLMEVNRGLVDRAERAASAAFAHFTNASDAATPLPVDELCHVRGGSTPRTSEPSYWVSGTIAWATPKDLSRLPSTPLLATERRITEAGLGQISSGLLPAGTLLMSSRAPVGYLAIAELPVAVNQGFIAMVCDRSVSNYFLWQWLKANMDQVLARANGSTFQEISKANFRPLLVDVPPAADLAAFDRTVAPLYRAIVELEREIATLQQARDELLPLLMLGRVVPGEAAS